MIRIALAQHDFLVGDVPGNLRKARDCIETARAAGARLVLFPELALTGYPPEDLLLRPGFMRQVHTAVDELAREVQGIDVVIGHPWMAGGVGGERDVPLADSPDEPARQGARHNSVSWLRDGAVMGRYFKHLLPNYAVFDEARYFTPGEDALVVEVDGFSFGVLICEDAWQPGPAAKARAAGARALLIPNASPYRDDKQEDRDAVFARRSHDTGLPMAYCNLTGGQDELVFDGRSVLVGADGSRQAQGPLCREALLLADFNPETGEFSAGTCVFSLKGGEISAETRKESTKNGGVSAETRKEPTKAGGVSAETSQRSPGSADVPAKSWPPPPAVKEEEIYEVLLTGLRDYIHKNGFSEVVFGLSGGIDSALTLALAVDALGADKVHCVMMPSRFTSRQSLDLAREQAEMLGVDYRTISIERAFAALLTDLAPSFAGVDEDVTEENLQARIRGDIIMALSNKFGWLPLATSNKSELAVGYSTIYGDMCGGFSPLKDCLKTRVYALCAWRNAPGAWREGATAPPGDAGARPAAGARVVPAIPQAVIDRAPSAELRPDQLDQDSLPPYEVLDEVLHRFVDLDWSIARIVADGFDEAMVRRVAGLVLINEYKRRQGAPGTRITSRGFGRDRRYPITSGWRERA